VEDLSFLNIVGIIMVSLPFVIPVMFAIAEEVGWKNSGFVVLGFLFILGWVTIGARLIES